MRSLRSFFRKADRKRKTVSNDNKGSSFVLVMVTIALIMILLAVIFVMIFLQYRMLRLSKQSKNNFYYLEEVLDEMRAGVGNVSMEALKTSYDETEAMVVYYDTNKKKYMSTSSQTAMDILNNKFLEKIAQNYCTESTGQNNDKSINTDALETLLKSYVKQLNENTQANFDAGITTDGVKVSFGQNFSCKAVTTKNPIKTIGYSMNGIKVSRKDPKTGNIQSIDTDISIYPPKNTNFNFLASGGDIDNVFTYAMVADYGVEVGSPTTSTNARIVGSVYAGSDTRNNGIYHGTVVSADATSTSDYKITGDTRYDVAPTTPNASQYSGLFVTGNDTKLNLQTDVLSVNGDIAVEGDATIFGSQLQSGSTVGASTIYAKNISTVSSRGNAKNTKNLAVESQNKDYNINLNGNFKISDDLELLADKSSVTLQGQYFGYNYAAEEESQAASADASQITSVKPKTHTNSSAVIINGRDTTLDLSGLRDLVINGRSYVDLTAENVSGNAATASENAKKKNNTNIDIKMSDSIAQKGSQLLYRATDEQNLSTVNENPENRSLFKEGTDVYGTGSNETLRVKVPYYNMIKFLTYRFAEDGVDRLYAYGNDKTNPVYDSNYEDIRRNAQQTKADEDKDKGAASKDTKKKTVSDIVYSEIWKDMETQDGGVQDSKYYKSVTDFYFPKESKISASYDAKKKGLVITDKKNNKRVKVTDSYGNVMNIWRNDNTEENGGKGICTGVDDKGYLMYAHRYGFIPVTENGDMESLVKTSVNGKEYYYFQFYDEDAKKQFVLDYADFCKATIDGQPVTQAQDGTSVDTFSVDSISLPDTDLDPSKNVYTRGISAVLEAGTDSYTLKDAKASSMYDEVNLMNQYNTSKNNYLAYRCYFPEKDSDVTATMLSYAGDMYNNGLRDSVTDNNYSYSTRGEDISALSNPDCLNISWRLVGDSKYKTGNRGEELKGYPGTRVWISDSDLVIDGRDYSNGSTKGIILCQGNVTFNNMTSFKGTVICAGKLKILGSTNFYTDQLMCENMLENDTDNQIRTCMGLSPFKEANEELGAGTRLSSISYTDIVAYENWVKNYGD